MKKNITEERTICDICKREDFYASHKCLVCGRDLCIDHVLVVDIAAAHQRPGFLAYLCPYDANIFKEPLERLLREKGSWDTVGQNPEYNVARLKEILNSMLDREGQSNE